MQLEVPASSTDGKTAPPSSLSQAVCVIDWLENLPGTLWLEIFWYNRDRKLFGFRIETNVKVEDVLLEKL